MFDESKWLLKWFHMNIVVIATTTSKNNNNIIPQLDMCIRVQSDSKYYPTPTDFHSILFIGEHVYPDMSSKYRATVAATYVGL